MNPEFVSKIKKWVEFDNKIEKFNSEVKNLKDQKVSLSNEITSFMIDNKMNDSVIGITGGKLKLVENNVSNPLTFKFLEESLLKYYNNDQDEVTKLIAFLKNSREYKKNYHLKRYHDNQ